MRVLIFGGTGAMGTPLQQHLLSLGHEVHVTSRSKHEDGKVFFHCGNAHNNVFLEELLCNHFDVVVDFMSYKTAEFKKRVSQICESTGQYIFISSSRVYSRCEGLITEDHPRLLDVCNDKNYLKTDEYALAKARQEDVLKSCGYSNWTIVRPSLTYNSNRLQYALGEKEEWLFRFLNNEKIVMPMNLRNTLTTMSYGDDVSHAISLLCGNRKAYGEVVHIAGASPISWDEVNNIYRDVLVKRYNREPEYVYIEDWEKLGKGLHKYYQLKYARSVSRKFDNSKLEELIGDIAFTNPQEGLSKCLSDCLDNLHFNKIPWNTEALYNKITKDNYSLKYFSGVDRLKYIIGRYSFYFELT